MAEKLNIFVAFYTEKATAFVNEKKAKVDEYKAERKNAIDSLKLSVSEKYPTLGDLVKDMFPENGGVNIDLFNNVYSKLSGLTKEDKSVISKLNKLSKSQTQYDRANLLLNKGGEKYFNELLDVLKGKTSLGDIIKDGPAGLEKFLADLDNVPESPPKIESSQELFDAISEESNKPSSEKQKESPINQTAKTSTEKETESSAINKTESNATPTGEPSSSAITATGTNSKPSETESTVKTESPAINTQTTGEKTTAGPGKTGTSSETKKEPTSLKTESLGAAKTSEKPENKEIVLGGKELSDLKMAEKAEIKKQEKITTISEKLNISSEKKEDVKNILNQYSQIKSKAPTTEKITTSQALLESMERSKEVAQSLGKIGAPSPAITQTSTSSTASTEITNEFENVQSSSTGATTINQNTQNTNSTSTVGAKTASTVNAPKTLTEDQKQIINNYRQKVGLLTPEQKREGAALDKSIEVKKASESADGLKEPSVEKEKIVFDQKIKPTPTGVTSNLSQNIQTVNSPVVDVKENKETSIAASTNSVSPQKEETAAPSKGSIVMDNSQSEKILRQILTVLSGKLEVKIS